MIRHLYVHTPFCAKICPYCAFYVHQGGAAQQREFVAALRAEWQRAREEFPLALETIYFGGGTPSILSAELFSELAELIPRQNSEVAVGPAVGSKVPRVAALVRAWPTEAAVDLRATEIAGRDGHPLPSDLFKGREGTRGPTWEGTVARSATATLEFTLEVNPATVTPEKAAAWRAAGVNRISLGAQSFDEKMLKILGRQHAPGDIAETCALLREHGFDNLNIDLMFALPEQSEAEWETTVHAALACAPKHISAYALTYEEDTPFFEKLRRGEWRQDEAREIAMFTRTREMLGAAGLIDYEISNFALPGFESRHNLGYWRGADYLGLGPSACSTIGGMRWRNLPDTRAYAEKLARGESVRTELETLDAATRTKERIMFGLRMREGVALDEFGDAMSRLKNLETEGLAFEEAGRIRLTPRGQLVADSVAGMFV